MLRTGGQAGARGARDLVGVRPGADSAPVDLVATTFDEKAARVSPNGRWLVYESNETGRDEVFVRPFPNTADGKWQVSTTGGTMPLWAHNGRELFYVNGSDEMTVATFESEPTFRVIDRRSLFPMDPTFVLSLNYTAFDISADDERFLMMRSVRATDPSAAPIVVENWIEELRALVRD